MHPVRSVFSQRISRGARCQAFTGQETITIDAVSPTTLQSTVATLATKQDVLDYVPSGAVSTATVQTATLLAPGGTIHGQRFTGGENITAKTLTPGDHLFGDAYPGQTNLASPQCNRPYSLTFCPLPLVSSVYNPRKPGVEIVT